MKLISFTLILMANSLFAQTTSKAYNTLLKTMYKNSVPTITVAELKTEKNVLLLDTRERPEFEVSHLKNARWVGYDDFELSRVADIDKNTKVVVYCTVGVRSEKIGEKLLAAGFKNVRNLYGSIFEWKNQDNAIYDANQHPTERVHAYSRVWGIWLKKGVKVYE